MGFGESQPSLRRSLEHWAKVQPHNPFIVEADEHRSITYAAFRDAVYTLQRTLGNRPRRIVLALPGGIPAAIVWIAALTGGHRLIPCAPESTDSERELLGKIHNPQVLVVAESKGAEGFGRSEARVLTLDNLYALIDDKGRGRPRREEVPLPAASGTVRLTTSGTTGEPKGVLLTAEQIAWTADQVRASHHLTSADRGLCLLPFFHINAPVVSLCGSLMAGSTLIIAPRFSLHRFWDWVECEQITWASVVPTIVALLVSAEKPSFLPGTLRFLRTASAPLPAAHHLAFEERFGIPVVETYGLSEAASQVTANPVPPGCRKVGSVGLPTGIDLRICRPEPEAETNAPGSRLSRLYDVGSGEEGEICVRGASVISRYEGRTGSGSFNEGWFRTGDLGYQDQDGYVYITGRLREVINRGGEKVAPREIEESLLNYPGIRDAAVTSEPDPVYGQRIVAYVVLAEDHGVQEDEQRLRLRDYCLSLLSAYKVPETFYIVPALPRNANGKLARKSLATMGRPQPPQKLDAVEELRGRPLGVLAHG